MLSSSSPTRVWRKPISCRLGNRLRKSCKGVPPFDGSYDYYFYITRDGLRSLNVGRAREDWPLDDEHDVIPGWPGLSE